MLTAMRAFSWFLRLFLFGFLLAFALLNVEPVSLRFFFDQTWQMPLIALLLGFFAAGMLFGAMAMIGPLVRARREAARLRKAAKTNEKQKQAEGQRAASDAVALPPAQAGSTDGI